MCEELPPVKALNFLQTEVSSVVDHSNLEEAESFRMLLSHLLSRPPAITPPPSRPQSSLSKKTTPGSSPSRKRSRTGSPAGSWTSKIDEDEIMAELIVAPVGPKPSVSSISARLLTAEEDEMEPGEGRTAVSAAMFEQRTEMFETLLGFIAEDEKQPSKDLLDILDLDAGA
jgi:hypothetical protein